MYEITNFPRPTNELKAPVPKSSTENLFQDEIKNRKEFEDKVVNLFIGEYNDRIPSILLSKQIDFLSSISTGVRMTLESMYSPDVFEEKQMREIFEKSEKIIKRQFYLPSYKTLSASWNDYETNSKAINKYSSKNENIKISSKNHENFSFLKHFRRHCINSDALAYHHCSEKAKMLEVWDETKEPRMTHVICIECRSCYTAESVLLKCLPCDIQYYSSVLEAGDNPDMQPATWSKYHCCELINDVMRCIKCKNTLFLNLKTNLLNCINEKCKFEASSNSIMWSCVMCKKEFKSDAKIYNPLEFKQVKHSIKLALLLKQRAKPQSVPCCNVNVYSKIFYHKKDCEGEVFQGRLDKKVIVVCSKCHSMNFYEKYIWTCPICNKRFKQTVGEKKSNKKVFIPVERESISNFKPRANDCRDTTSFSEVNSCSTSPKKAERKSQKKKSLMEILQERKTSRGASESISENPFRKGECVEEISRDLSEKFDEIKLEINKTSLNEGDEPKSIPQIQENESVQNHLSNLTQENLNHINIDDFTIIKQIGEGSYGKIYLIEDKHKNEYAMKKIIAHDMEELEARKKEFNMMNNFKHESIMGIYGVAEKTLDTTTYALYIIMERANRDWDDEIRERLDKKTPYSEEELLEIIKQLVQALAFLQKNQISHRDIKPMNILVYDNNVYKVGDFGEAKEVKMAKQESTLRGTEIYMSPLLFESLKDNKEDVNHNVYKSDVFSLGYCLLYAATLSFQSINDIRDLTNMKAIYGVLNKYLKSKYSPKLMTLLYKMIDIYERTRFDFIDLEKYLNEKVFNI